MSIVQKKYFYNFFFIPLYKLRRQTINQLMNHSLHILSSGVKFALNLVHFKNNFELQLQKATKLFQLLLQFVRMKSSKNPFPRFLITFLLFEILACYIFVAFEIDAKNRKSFTRLKSHIFCKIAGAVFLSGYIFKCTPFPKELRQRFFKIKLQHYALTENSLRRLTLFHWYCNFDVSTRLNDM